MEEEIKLAEKIYECRKNKNREQEKELVKELEIALNGKTTIPGIGSFRTYEGEKDGKITSTTKFIFEKDYKGA